VRYNHVGSEEICATCFVSIEPNVAAVFLVKYKIRSLCTYGDEKDKTVPYITTTTWRKREIN
jgi:hypothetical protein